MFTRVCKAETIPEGCWRLVIADAQAIVLAWPENGVLKAYQGVCPHNNAPLADAEFDGTVLTCPRHFWTWDLNKGTSFDPNVVPLAEYPVKVEDGIVFIDTAGIIPQFAPP